MTLIEQLLTAWRTTRDTQLADALSRIDDPSWAATQKSILRSKGTQNVLVPQICAVIDALEPDPRQTVLFLEALRDARWPGTGTRAIWERIFKRLVDLRDRRAIDPLKAALAHPPHFLGKAHTTWVLEQVRQTAQALEQQQPPGATDVSALLAQVEALQNLKPAPFAEKKNAGVPTELIERVFANPDDDSLRLVLADALLEQGDAWGELIQLQFSATPDQARVAKLIQKHGVAIAGPLAHLAPRGVWRFDKGFLDLMPVSRVMVPRRRWEDAVSAPQWATVREVQLNAQDLPQWWLSPWLRQARLERVRTITMHDIVLRRATAAAPWQASLLRDRGQPYIPGQKTLLAFVAALPTPSLFSALEPRIQKLLWASQK